MFLICEIQNEKIFCTTLRSDAREPFKRSSDFFRFLDDVVASGPRSYGKSNVSAVPHSSCSRLVLELLSR